MYDVITIGSSVVDIYVMSSQFRLRKTDAGLQLCEQYGTKIDVDSFKIRSGGGGSNTAVGFARLGFSVGIVSETGKDAFSQVILEDLHEARVSINLIAQEKKEETGGSIVLVGKDGGRTILVHRGASTMLDPEDLPVGHIQRARWIPIRAVGHDRSGEMTASNS